MFQNYDTNSGSVPNFLLLISQHLQKHSIKVTPEKPLRKIHPVIPTATFIQKRDTNIAILLTSEKHNIAKGENVKIKEAEKITIFQFRRRRQLI